MVAKDPPGRENPTFESLHIVEQHKLDLLVQTDVLVETPVYVFELLAQRQRMFLIQADDNELNLGPGSHGDRAVGFLQIQIKLDEHVKTRTDTSVILTLN
jgi:hypothetical protein